MKQGMLIGIMLGSLVGLGCGGAQRYDWQERYRRDYRQPYDLYALHELFRADPAGRPVVSIEDSLQVFLPDTAIDATYFFAGNQVFLAEEEWTALFGWVSQGNTAFISSRQVPDYLDRALRMYAGCYTLDENLGNYILSDSVALSREGYDTKGETTCALVHRERFAPVTTYWSYVDPPYYCDIETVENLGYLDYEWTNFFRFAAGDGYIYVHLAPQAFTNFQLRDPEVFAYANACLNVLGSGTIYWDEYHKSPYDTYQGPPEGQQNPPLLRSNHALRYLLSEPALATGWYLLVALAVLFVIFRAKRRQAVVPVRRPRENTSFAYLQDIGQLFYQSSNHRQLAEEQRKLFVTHLRNRYGLAYRNDAACAADLATRAGITPEQAACLQREIQHLDQGDSEFGHGDLMRFYRALEVVYRSD